MLSPEVASTVTWFLRRWASIYLSFKESFYSEISPALLSAFGQGTEGAAWSVGFLLGKAASNLASPGMGSEPALVKDTVHLLVSLVDSREK